MAKNNKPESKTKKIVNIVVMVIEIMIIIASIVLSIAVITGSKVTNKELGDGYNLTVVLSASMDGNEDRYEIKSFAIDDLVIIKSLTDEEKRHLQVGDVVIYRGVVNGESAWITHRITKVEYREDLDVQYYYTKGDAEAEGKDIRYLEGTIQGKVVKVIPKVGKIIRWFQDATNFLWAVVIPLAALLIYNVIVFIRAIVNARIKRIEEKSKQDLEDVKASILKELAGVDKPLDEEEIKKKAIEEYLAMLNAKKEDSVQDAPSAPANSEEKGE